MTWLLVTSTCCSTEVIGPGLFTSGRFRAFLQTPRRWKRRARDLSRRELIDYHLVKLELDLRYHPREGNWRALGRTALLVLYVLIAWGITWFVVSIYK